MNTILRIGVLRLMACCIVYFLVWLSKDDVRLQRMLQMFLENVRSTDSIGLY